MEGRRREDRDGTEMALRRRDGGEERRGGEEGGRGRDGTAVCMAEVRKLDGAEMSSSALLN